ncbi:hypothetical protein MsAm2_04130 [Methanolapillus ohkumae]|uniref:S-layer family duplication domain-containing protein n=2 Tax=Methanolapillus ohkumae TaxID=3028298 RepID=A0AA96VE60_9EURY|nr:hypothetical protein MsAm2_04130 [Methanosarcinaceae archaeon Am2]
MQMKHLIVALIVLLVLAGTASAATSVDIRSSIIKFAGDAKTFNYDDGAAGTNAWKLDAMTWAGFYYDLNNNRFTENLLIKQNGTAVKVDIKYTTAPQFVEYEYTWKSGANNLGYSVIGFFAEPYVAISNNSSMIDDTDLGDADKIAKLVIDSNDKYTLSTGQSLDLGNGYTMVANQIDVNGDKAYFSLLKDGKEIDTGIINASDKTNNNDTWFLNKTILGVSNAEYLRVHVNQVFQGTSSSLVEIKGIWLIDVANAIEVDSETDYGKFEASSIGKTELVYEAKGIALTDDMSTDLGKGILLETQKNFTGAANLDKFYFLKSYTTPGKYEVRSTVTPYADDDQTTLKTYKATVPALATDLTGAALQYDYLNFAAFYYNVDANAYTEFLMVDLVGSPVPAATATTYKIAEGDLLYYTQAKPVGYEYNWKTSADAKMNYYVIGLFGEAYVPFNMNATNDVANPNVDVEKISKLVLDSNDKYVLSTGQTLDLGSGYTIVPNQIDVNGDKVYFEFFKDGKSVDSSIINASEKTNNNDTWVYDAELLGEKNVQILRVHVNQVFQGTESSLVEIKGIWLMDYATAQALDTDDSFGALDFDGKFSYKDIATNTGDNLPTLKFSSNKDISITADSDSKIANNLYYKAGSKDTPNTLKNFYFYVVKEVDGSGPTPDNNTTTPVPPTPEPPQNNTTQPEPPKDNNTTTPAEPTPSFWDQYKWWIIGAIVLIIIIGAGAYYYFNVYSKKN